ncbi:MAG: TlpA family protein disulfide reductase [Fidelibacterota bacterium]|nr:MAG: TlpA family protein disulfide reductase [Candidatus Neomarinimicrobiota bacterium]
MRAKILLSVLVCFSLASAQLEIGQEAPSFYLPRLEGGSFYMSRTVGPKAKVEDRIPVVVSFFQTTCVPCKAEIAELEKLQEEFPLIKIFLVGLNEPDELVAEYVEKFDLKLNMLLDRYGVTGKKYGVVDENGVALLPNTYIVATDGSIYYHHTGFKPGDEEIYREKFAVLTEELEAERAARAAALAQEKEQQTAEEKQHDALAIGQPAPTFFLPYLEGGSFYLSRTVGPKAKEEDRKPVVVSFFQTTCVPCKAEIAELEKLQEEFPGVTIYLVDLNESDELVREYIERFDLKLQMLMDRYGAVGKKYKVVDEKSGLAILPNSFIVAQDGTIYYHHTGFKPGDEELYRKKFVELTSH